MLTQLNASDCIALNEQVMRKCHFFLGNKTIAIMKINPELSEYICLIIRASVNDI